MEEEQDRTGVQPQLAGELETQACAAAMPTDVRPVTRHASRIQSPRLLDRLRSALQAKHYSPRTEEVYARWVRSFVVYHHLRHPDELGEPEINAFLTDLAVRLHVSY